MVLNSAMYPNDVTPKEKREFEESLRNDVHKRENDMIFNASDDDFCLN